MEKLSTEEKAKAWDEALKRTKESLKDGTISSNTISYIKEIFPELKENDEKIRKALIDFFATNAENGEQTNGIYDKEIVAWLEKQGVQKQITDCPDNPKDNWELVQEFVERLGRIPKDEDELNLLVEYVLKRQNPTWNETKTTTISQKSINLMLLKCEYLKLCADSTFDDIRDALIDKELWEDTLKIALHLEETTRNVIDEMKSVLTSL